MIMCSDSQGESSIEYWTIISRECLRSEQPKWNSSLSFTLMINSVQVAKKSSSVKAIAVL